MPKIDAPTVAEHRAHMEHAILAATVDLLVSDGEGAVTPAAVAARAGLARTSVYQYHRSSAALVAAAVEELFRRAAAEMRSALDGVGEDPTRRLEAYVVTTLRLAREGHQPTRAVVSLSGAPTDCRTRIRELHDELMAPLAAIVRDHGVADVATVTAFAGGTIQAAAQLVEHGRPLSDVSAATCDFLGRALAARRN